MIEKIAECKVHFISIEFTVPLWQLTFVVRIVAFMLVFQILLRWIVSNLGQSATIYVGLPDQFQLKALHLQSKIRSLIHSCSPLLLSLWVRNILLRRRGPLRKIYQRATLPGFELK